MCSCEVKSVGSVITLQPHLGIALPIGCHGYKG